jgi:hypothetical protein
MKQNAQGKRNQKERAKKLLAILDGNYELHENEQNVMDILADIRHFCDIHKIDYYEQDRRALRHYQAERAGED